MENYLNFNKCDLDSFNAILNKYKAQKNIFNNFYENPTDTNEIDVFSSGNTLLIRKLYNGFYRCYIISSNYSETVFILKNLNFEHVINIPSKRPIDEWAKLFDECEYSCYGIYERMFYQGLKRRTKRVPSFAVQSDLDVIYKTLYYNFNKILDHLPTKENLLQMINNKQIIISQHAKAEKGVLIYTFEGKKCYLNAWIDKSGEGFLLLLDAFSLIQHNQINYTYFWVNSENTHVKKIHEILGAKPDGLKDYTYIKKI